MEKDNRVYPKDLAMLFVAAILGGGISGYLQLTYKLCSPDSGCTMVLWGLGVAFVAALLVAFAVFWNMLPRKFS